MAINSRPLRTIGKHDQQDDFDLLDSLIDQNKPTKRKRWEDMQFPRHDLHWNEVAGVALWFLGAFLTWQTLCMMIGSRFVAVGVAGFIQFVCTRAESYIWQPRYYRDENNRRRRERIPRIAFLALVVDAFFNFPGAVTTIEQAHEWAPLVAGARLFHTTLQPIDRWPALLSSLVIAGTLCALPEVLTSMHKRGR